MSDWEVASMIRCGVALVTEIVFAPSE
ncbi:hypothetical protein PIIN_11023 [Serendipita indica DSM 11827]|uniref:Uncharacterized protein n=1 Tax=Serendipita indica (strain DSM 11827) TaxID=1109443 RepID=G4U0E5_SERID|nr:hypothetical protein PIIN_11023 [Serendipita indica DSM 11827]